jgi:hypothetical protein
MDNLLMLSHNFKNLPYEIKFQILTDVYKNNNELLLTFINNKIIDVFHNFYLFPITSNDVGLQLWKLAITKNDIVLLEKLHKNYVIRPFNLVDFAIKHGNFETMIWIHKKFKIECHNIHTAVKSGDFKKVQWIHKNTTGNSWRDILLDAIDGGSLEIIKYVFDNNIGVRSFNALDKACATGDINIVKYLSKIHRNSCTIKSIDTAAENGYIEVVKFLLQNTDAVFSQQAMAGAASNGHLEIVKILMQHKKNYYLDVGFKLAAANGHLSIVKLIYEVDNLLTLPVMTSIRNGQLEIFKWICEVGDPIEYYNDVEFHALKYKQFHITEWYRDTYNFNKNQ